MRTVQEVLAAQRSVAGCCDRHADNMACSCLEEAERGQRKRVTITCSCCGGTGRVELNGAYLETLDRLRRHGAEVSGAELARLMRVKPTAMNNRLALLERVGLATSRRYGRTRLFKAKEQA